jgi:hypothetical protein
MLHQERKESVTATPTNRAGPEFDMDTSVYWGALHDQQKLQLHENVPAANAAKCDSFSTAKPSTASLPVERSESAGLEVKGGTHTPFVALDYL